MIRVKEENMRVIGTKLAKELTFTYLNSLGLHDIEAYVLKKGVKEIFVDDKASDVLIKRGFAVGTQKPITVKYKADPKPKKTKTITDKQEESE